MKKITTIFLAVTGLFIFSLSGCKDNSTDTFTASIQSASDNAVVESEYASIFEYVDDQGENTTFFSIAKSDNNPQILEADTLLPGCATRTIDTANRILIIDFGTTNCLCLDGMYRRGKIICQFNDKKFREIGSKVTVTLQDYYFNDNKVMGIKTIERIAAFKWSIKVDSASVTTPDGIISWNSNRTVEKTAGYLTLYFIWDDEYVYTGTASGINKKGVAFTVTIDQPLVKKIQVGCASTFIAGVLTITNDKGDTMTLNYDPIGGEPCDKIGEVTINGVTRRITLR